MLSWPPLWCVLWLHMVWVPRLPLYQRLWGRRAPGVEATTWTRCGSDWSLMRAYYCFILFFVIFGTHFVCIGWMNKIATITSESMFSWFYAIATRRCGRVPPPRPSPGRRPSGPASPSSSSGESTHRASSWQAANDGAMGSESEEPGSRSGRRRPWRVWRRRRVRRGFEREGRCLGPRLQAGGTTAEELCSRRRSAAPCHPRPAPSWPLSHPVDATIFGSTPASSSSCSRWSPWPLSRVRWLQWFLA